MTLAANDDDARGRMDRMYRHQRRIYDITRRHFLLGRKHLLDNLCPPGGGTILEVGCGTAFNLIQAARRYPQTRCYGFDVSTEMLMTARQSVTLHALTDRISLASGDATDFDACGMFGVQRFDRIFTSYTLSMIPQWPLVVDEMLRQLAPGGVMHVVDFGECAGLPVVAKTLLLGWLDKFGVEPRLYLAAVLRDRAQKNNSELVYQSLFRGYAQYGAIRPR